MSVNLKIEGQSIKNPTTFAIQKYNLTKAGRVASGKMTMDLVAKKRKFLLTYDVLSGTDLEHINSIIDTENMFMNVQYTENGITKSATCYVGQIEAARFRTDGVWYWKDVKFDLIEQ